MYSIKNNIIVMMYNFISYIIYSMINISFTKYVDN